MKGLTLKVVAGLLALTVIANPVLLNAQEKVNKVDVCAQAKSEANADVNSLLWAGVGFFGQLAGVALAYGIQTDPPASRLLGKSPKYVATYIDCYRKAARDVQFKYSIYGCIGCVSLELIIVVITLM
ncbi:MAG: hypothetical protein DRQ03_01800 [Candidatus Hydrothermota bacterium]|nr:MAG: hypothetical protein DRQ03_01800 [Candidatus Hydrothermae bacterium]